MAFLVTNYRWGGSIYRRWVGSFLCGGGIYGFLFSMPTIIHNNENSQKPVHPGEVLRDELEEIGLTQTALAKHIGVLPKTVNEICRGKRGISARPLRNQLKACCRKMFVKRERLSNSVLFHDSKAYRICVTKILILILP